MTTYIKFLLIIIKKTIYITEDPILSFTKWTLMIDEIK